MDPPVKPTRDRWTVFAAFLVAFFFVAVFIGLIVLGSVFLSGDNLDDQEISFRKYQ